MCSAHQRTGDGIGARSAPCGDSKWTPMVRCLDHSASRLRETGYGVWQEYAASGVLQTALPPRDGGGSIAVTGWHR
jgi:DNA-binding IclR family transcriptional regulator